MTDLSNLFSKCLPKLFGSFQDINHINVAIGIVDAIHQACLKYPIKEKHKGNLCLHVFNENYGLIKLLKEIINVNMAEVRILKTKLFKLFDDFLDLVESKAVPYCSFTKDLCIMYVKRESTAVVKKAATVTLSKVLEICQGMAETANLDIKSLIQDLFFQLSIRKVTPTVKEEIHCLLGVISHFYPEDFIPYSERILNVYIQELKKEIFSKTTDHNLNIITGCLLGLKEYLFNFTVSYVEDKDKSLQVYQFAKCAIEAKTEKKYGMLKAGLQLLAAHASQFAIYLYDDAQKLYEIITDVMNHSNRDLQKIGLFAIDALLKQVVEILPNKIKENHSSAIEVFNYFMKDFKKKLLGDVSGKQITISVKGYGLFAGACKSLSGEIEVNRMFLNISQRSENLFLGHKTDIENIITQLPSFLESLASIVKELENVTEAMLSSLEKLIIFQIENFPYAPSPHRFLVTQALIKVFLAMQTKREIFPSFLSKIVYQGMIRTCSHSLIADIEAQAAEEETEMEIEFIVKNPRYNRIKTITYKDYLYLWSTLLNIVQWKELNAAGVPLILRQNLKEAVYDEIIKSTILLFHKLNLSVKANDMNKKTVWDETADVEEHFSSDPLYGLYPNNFNDCRIFLNLVDFLRDFLENNCSELFEKWVYTFGKETVYYSTKYPLNSGFYKLAALNLNICTRTGYFKDSCFRAANHSEGLTSTDSKVERTWSFYLFSKFAKEVVVRSQQFKDDLLASCLLVLLALPTQIIKSEIHDLIPALQSTFKLGLSYIPLAETGLNTLEYWSKEVPPETMKEVYSDVLPLLNHYLMSSGVQGHKVTENISKRKSRKDHKISVKYVKVPTKTVGTDVIEETELAKLQHRIIAFLGSIGNENNRSMLKHAFEDAQVAALAWDANYPNHLKYPVPFIDMKPEIYFDEFLPPVLELATSSSDRQVKVAACEVLHSFVLYIVGRGSQLPEALQEKASMEKLYKHIFPGLLKLSCDVDQVTKQLFTPLVLQLTRWFTHRKTIHTLESQVILLALWDGVTDQQSASMRDFSALCLKEYFMWALKQSKEEGGGEKNFFKKMSSFSVHPNPYKRLGAALVFNNIYVIFRNEEKLVQKYTLELLVQFVDSLAIAHSDDTFLGTQKLSSDALDHIERICKVKSHLFIRQHESCYKPRCLKKANLESAIEWLLCQCGNPQTECRHKCMELVSKLASFIPGLSSTSEFMRMYVLNGNNICQEIFEKKLVYIGVPPEVPQPSWKMTLNWIEALIASLECYNWALMENLIQYCDEWLSGAVIFRALDFFIEKIVSQNIDDVGYFQNGKMSSNCSPKEILEYNRIKCSALMRLYTLFEMLQGINSTLFFTQFVQHLWNNKFWEVIILTVINPRLLGFDLTDYEVSKQLSMEMLKVLKTKKCQEKSFKIFCCQYLASNKNYELSHLIPFDFSCTDFDYVFYEQMLSGYDVLIKSNLWPAEFFSATDKNNFLEAIIHNLFGIACKDDFILQKSSLSLPVLNFAKQLLIISSTLEMEPENFVNKLLDPVSITEPDEKTNKALLIFNMFENEMCGIMCKLPDRFIPLLVNHVTTNQFNAVSILIKFLNVTSTVKEYRKKYGPAVVATVMNCWNKLQIWWEGSSDLNLLNSILSILTKLILIDSEVATNSNGKYSLSLFHTYNALLRKNEAPLDFKVQLLDLLPFFFSENDEEIDILKLSLENIIILHFPISSKELIVGSSQYNCYLSAVKKLLSAFKLAGNKMLLELLTMLFCREEKHIMEEEFVNCVQSLIKSVPPDKHQQFVEVPWRFIKDKKFSYNTCLHVMDCVCLTILRSSALSAFVQFYVSNITSIVSTLKEKLYSFSGENELTAKINSFKLMEILYSRLPKDQLHTSESQVVRAYVGGQPAKGNELTSTTIQLALEFKRENMVSKTVLKDLYRKLYCSSLNTLIAVIACTQNELKFYNTFIFKENLAKDEKIWENVIDSTKKYVFDIELDEPLIRQKKFISIRRHCRESDPVNDEQENAEDKLVESSLHFMASQNLALSSLADDVSKFDFSTTEEVFSKKKSALSSEVHSHAASDPEVEYIEMEVDELNQHECMAPLSWLLHHMANQGLIPTEQQVAVPLWLEAIIAKLEDARVSNNIKLFLARLIINNCEVLFPYAQTLIKPLMGLINSGTLGNDLNYNVLDVIIIMLSWAPKVIPVNDFVQRHEASSVLEFLIRKCAHPRKDVFRNNLEVVKTVLECWRERIEIPYRQVYEMLKFPDPTSKENVTGIQLLGVILTSKFPPYSDGETEGEMFLNYLVSNLNNKYQEIFAAASEVIGLILKYKMLNNPKISEDSFFNRVIQRLSKLKDGDHNGKFLTCLYKIHFHCPEIVHRFFPKLLLMQQKLQGIFYNYSLQMLCSCVNAVKNGFYELKSIGLFENIEHREEEIQHIILQSLEKVSAELSCDEVLKILPFLVTIHSQPSTKCRLVLYNMLMALYDKYRFNDGAKEKEILRLSQETLLKALADSDLSLRLVVNNFWSSENRLPVATKDRLISLLKNMYSPPTESSFLQSATFLLLERTSHSPDYKRKVFEHPLSECNFLAYNISTSWRQRYAPMTPLFVDSMSNSSFNMSLASMNASSFAENQQLIKATQQQLSDFSATNEASSRGSTFNWLTDKSMDTFGNFESHASSSLNTYNPPKSHLLATKKMKSGEVFKKTVSANQNAKEKLEKANVWHLKRRFLRDRKVDSNVFAKIEIRRQDLRQEIHKEQQKRRESEVTIYRKYRIGELPDIEISNSAIIAPLQALAQNDANIAKMLMKSILVSIYNYLKSDSDIVQPFASEISKCLCTILKESREHIPSVMSFCLESLYQIGWKDVDPEVIFFASLNSSQQSIGILLLESKILSFDAPEPNVKRFKSNRKPIEPSTSQWIRLSELHKSLKDYDVVNGIFSHIMGNRDLNKKALEFESNGEYLEAVDLYKQLYQNTIDTTDENITQAEEDFWDKSILFCYNMLANWEALEQNVLSRFTDPQKPNLQVVWEEPYYRDNYLPFLVRSKVKCLIEGRQDQSLLSFFDEAQENEDRQSYIQENFAEELALLYIVQDCYEASNHYSSFCCQKFLKDWKELNSLAVTMRESKLQDLQKYLELKEFLEVISKEKLDSLEDTLQVWKGRNPSILDSLNIWNDINSNRLLYLKKFKGVHNSLTSQQSEVQQLNESQQSMEIDTVDAASSYLEHGVSFQLSYVNCCVNQGNITVALKCLKKIQKDVKSLGGHHELKFMEIYCRANHKKALKFKGEEKLKILLNSCHNLDKFAMINAMTTSQKLLRSETYKLLAEMFNDKEVQIDTISANHKLRILEISGCGSEKKITSALHLKSFSILKAAVESLEKKIANNNNDADIEIKSAYMALAKFCNENMQQREMMIYQGSAIINQDDHCPEYPKILIETLLCAMRFGDMEALQLFPRLLQVIESYPETLPYFVKQTSRVPSWMFISWINQMVALLDKPEAEGVHDIIAGIVDQYPNAIVYPFCLSCESYCFADTPAGRNCKTFVERMKAVFKRDHLNADFLEALQHLSVPHVLFKDYISKFAVLLTESNKEHEILELYNEMLRNLFAVNVEVESRRIPIGPAQKLFAEKYLGDVQEICGHDGKTILCSKNHATEVVKAFRSIHEKSKENDLKYKRASSLKELSPWLRNFQSWRFDTQIEIPGQYTGRNKPLPEYHVKIAGFDDKVLILSSITAPRRITMRGNDEKEYKILVKSGEDLRQDSRLQQLFGIMNDIYAKDPNCARRYLKLVTYKVFPLSPRFGLIEWVDGTVVLNDFLDNSKTLKEKNSLLGNRIFQSKLFNWAGNPHDNIASIYKKMYKDKNRMQSVKMFEELVQLTPKNLLKRAFLKLSSSPEAFLSLRSEFAKSHSVICISQWLLGVGDRHLGNFLIDLNSGREIGIDFGHAFGSATQFLVIPELIPFRLTNQYLQLMEPLREKGTLEATMIHTLSALRKCASLLINVLGVFIKEPTVDWKAHAEKQQRDLGISEEETKGDSNWFPKQRVEIAFSKLKGSNPCHIMKKELMFGHQKEAVFENMKSLCLGDEKFNIRARLGEFGLSVEEQVACLIDQATDPHLLCKTYVGWSPWM